MITALTPITPTTSADRKIPFALTVQKIPLTGNIFSAKVPIGDHDCPIGKVTL